MVAPILLREPAPSFTVDRRNNCVVWDANGLRLVHLEQFTVLLDIFAENGWRRHFLALGDAEMALSEVTPTEAVRAMLTASVATLNPMKGTIP